MKEKKKTSRFLGIIDKFRRTPKGDLMLYAFLDNDKLKGEPEKPVYRIRIINKKLIKKIRAGKISKIISIRAVHTGWRIHKILSIKEIRIKIKD